VQTTLLQTLSSVIILKGHDLMMNTQFNLLFRFILIAIFGLQITACTTKLGKGFQHLEDHNYPAALVLFEEVAEQDVRIAGILAADLHI
jgi:hypothetical protein